LVALVEDVPLVLDETPGQVATEFGAGGATQHRHRVLEETGQVRKGREGKKEKEREGKKKEEREGRNGKEGRNGREGRMGKEGRKGREEGE
jgi:hypothetical protein